MDFACHFEGGDSLSQQHRIPSVVSNAEWWFQIFCIFTPTCTWGDDPIWPIFLNGSKPPPRWSKFVPCLGKKNYKNLQTLFVFPSVSPSPCGSLAPRFEKLLYSGGMVAWVEWWSYMTWWLPLTHLEYLRAYCCYAAQYVSWCGW